MKKSSTAVWKGSGKEGKGHLSAESGALKSAPYSWASRFADEKNTNPEELIAAAHAGCFTMKLSFVLGDAGFTPDSIETKSEVSMEGGVITGSHLIVAAKVPGIDKEKFDACVKEAKENCPVSKALNMTITAEATLL